MLPLYQITPRVADLTTEVQNFGSSLDAYLPAWAQGWGSGAIVALITIIIGWLIAKIAAAVIAGVINKTGLGRKAKASGNNIGRSLSSAVFWVVWLIFILMGLGQFPQVAEQLGFLNTMMTDIFTFLPKLVLGSVILAIGIMLSRVVKNVITSTFEVARVDTMASKYGIGGQASVDGTPALSISASLAKLISSIVVIIFAIAAINIWSIPGISQPVSDMLDLVLSYIPRVLGAAVVLGIAVFIGRFVSNLAQSTLPATGIDNALSAIEGLDGDTSDSFKPSKIVGTIAFIGITLMGLTAAMSTLDIPALSDVFGTLLALGGKIVLGFVIIGAGVFIANVVTRMIKGAVGDTLANAIRYVIILLISFMGLSEMDLGDGIIESAFNWGIGATAVAGAIAFGLGGREWAKAKLHEMSPVKGGKK